MARRKKPAHSPLPNTGSEAIPPGATAQAADRPLNRGGGPPGSGAGPRHAAADEDSPAEEYGATDTNDPLADEPPERRSPEPDEEEGYGGFSGGAVGGSPAGVRSRGGHIHGGYAPGEGTRGDTTIGADPNAPTH
jgi:hypothetical protein